MLHAELTIPGLLPQGTQLSLGLRTHLKTTQEIFKVKVCMHIISILT